MRASRSWGQAVVSTRERVGSNADVSPRAILTALAEELLARKLVSEVPQLGFVKGRIERMEACHLLLQILRQALPLFRDKCVPSGNRVQPLFHVTVRAYYAHEERGDAAAVLLLMEQAGEIERALEEENHDGESGNTGCDAGAA